MLHSEPGEVSRRPLGLYGPTKGTVDPFPGTSSQKVQSDSRSSGGQAMSAGEYQARFFNEMGGLSQFRKLIELMPDVDYFAKDRDSRFVAISAGTLRRVGLAHEEELIGAGDDKIHPANVARAIREDDLQVMKTRQPLIDRVEALYKRSRTKDWFLTTKIPIVNSKDEVIGVMGTVRPFQPGASQSSGDSKLEQVVAFIRQNYRSRIAVSILAGMAHVSGRHLNRKFQETFRMSVQEYIIRLRIQSSGNELATTDKPIGEIAVDHAFYDQSVFTAQFKKYTGETPRAYRRARLNPTRVRHTDEL